MSRSEPRLDRPDPRDGRRRRGARSSPATGCCWWRSSQPDLCRAAVDIGRGHGFKVVATCSRTTRSWSPTSAGRTPRSSGWTWSPTTARRSCTGLKRHPQTRLIPTVVTHAAGGRRGRPRGPAARARSTSSRSRSPGRSSTACSSSSTRSSTPATGGCSSSPSRPTATPSPSPTGCRRSRRLDVDVVGSAAGRRGGARRDDATTAWWSTSASAAAAGSRCSSGSGRARRCGALPVVTTHRGCRSPRGRRSGSQPYADALTLVRPALARPRPRRGVAVPAPHRRDAGRASRRRPPDLVARRRAAVHGQADPDRRRRRPQRVRADQRAGAARHRRGVRRERRGRARDPHARNPRSTWC